MTAPAAALIREARQRAGLSQVELAGKTGVTQSVISTYEAGRRNPSFDMMTKLISAAGATITIEYVPSATPAPGLPNTSRGRKLRKHRHQILAVVQTRGASNVRVFGSVARSDDGPESDIDLLIDTPDGFSLFDLGGLIHETSTILGEKVDVVPARGLDKEFLDHMKGEVIPL